MLYLNPTCMVVAAPASELAGRAAEDLDRAEEDRVELGLLFATERLEGFDSDLLRFLCTGEGTSVAGDATSGSA